MSLLSLSLSVCVCARVCVCVSRCIDDFGSFRSVLSPRAFSDDE